jgi:hypothetical protein
MQGNPKLVKHVGSDGRPRMIERSIDLSALSGLELESLAGILASTPRTAR